MAIYLSAGHWRNDPGATGINGIKEADETIRLRDAVLNFIKPKYRVITDNDNESLAQYLNRIKPGNASVVMEIHFDAASNTTASGTTALVKTGANANSVAMGKEITTLLSRMMGITNRGCWDESKSHRGRLGLTHMPGITVLLEVCFITSKNDWERYTKNFMEVAELIAGVLMKYDDLIS